MAPPRVVDVRRRIVVVGEVRVAPGPQAILDRVVCHDYPRLTRKAHDVDNNTNKRPRYFDVREDLEEAVADLTSGANVVDGDGGRWYLAGVRLAAALFVLVAAGGDFFISSYSQPRAPSRKTKMQAVIASQKHQPSWGSKSFQRSSPWYLSPSSPTVINDNSAVEKIKYICNRMYCIHVPGHDPLIFSFLSFILFDWVGVLRP